MQLQFLRLLLLHVHCEAEDYVEHIRGMGDVAAQLDLPTTTSSRNALQTSTPETSVRPLPLECWGWCFIAKHRSLLWICVLRSGVPYAAPRLLFGLGPRTPSGVPLCP